MNAIIIYDSRRSRGATAKIAQTIAQTLCRHGIQAEAVRPGQAIIKDQELIVVGSPIYEERAMKTVTYYIEKNKDKLLNKSIAVFIVCMAQLASKPSMLYVEKRYLPQLTKRLLCKPIATKIFRGWIIRSNPNTITEAEKWAEKLVQLVKRKGIK